MDPTKTVRMQSKSALWQLVEGVSICLQFRMADGVHQVLQQKIHLTNMAKATIARKTVKEAAGQTMFTPFEVCRFSSLVKNLFASQFYNCQRVRPSGLSRRPHEAADYRAARRFVCAKKISQTLQNVE